jgi:CheY-like chemotaxis protein
VLGIVRGHRGALQVWSEPGRGTTFTIFLPTTEDRESKIEDRSSQAVDERSSILDPRSSEQSSVVGRQSPALSPSLRSRVNSVEGSAVGSVLVIEDDPGVRALTARMLQHFGYAVLTAADGCEGVATFGAQPDAFDCILLDMSMPQMDGVQTLQEIQRIRPDARVVLMSGYDQRDVTSRLEGQRLASVLTKPFSPATLREHIARAIVEIRD